jgi:hypothetical protein
MMFANATNLNRKCGVAERKDQFDISSPSTSFDPNPDVVKGTVLPSLYQRLPAQVTKVAPKTAGERKALRARAAAAIEELANAPRPDYEAPPGTGKR